VDRILIIQTSFLGDVILATGVLESLSRKYPKARIDMLVRKGNEGLLQEHPRLQKLWVWDKQSGKYRNLIQLGKKLRKEKYDLVINLHRFASSGFLTMMTGAPDKRGFDKNPFSFSYTKQLSHEIGVGKHELERNHELVADLTGSEVGLPALYPTKQDQEFIDDLKLENYVVIAPTSVWYTKQLPKEKWRQLIEALDSEIRICLIGAKADSDACEELMFLFPDRQIDNFAGKLNLLQSTELMKRAKMNYVNDSAPLHMATAVKSPVTAFFCSTVRDFGFYPYLNNGQLAEIDYNLDCRPCGLHGKKSCPEKHFKCALDIQVEKYVV
jgi:ADP-heptose:LPS heptosyltransferase